MLKEMRRDDSPVEYSFTGSDTRPKAMVEEPIARADIVQKRMFTLPGGATETISVPIRWLERR
jgi:hypothetical protein